jgi:hypothetical protein
LVNDVNLIDTADVIPRLFKADGLQEEVGIVACDLFPGNGVAGAAIVGGQRAVGASIQQTLI